MKPKEIKELRDARVFEQYDVGSIKLRVTNGDGAKWTKGITVKGVNLSKRPISYHARNSKRCAKRI